jgi:hypothetical protein
MPTQMSLPRVAYCGCEVTEVISAIRGTPKECPNCHNCIGTHCSCKNCRDCGLRTYAEEICTNCEYCIGGCCRCRKCSKAGCGVVKNGQFFCSKCKKCTETCCSCFTCKTCAVDFRENKLEFDKSCGQCYTHCVCYSCPGVYNQQIQGYTPGTQHKTSRKNACINSCRGCATCCRCVQCPNCQRKHLAGRRSFHTEIHFHFVGEEPCGRCYDCCPCNMTGVTLRSGKFTLFHSVFAKGQFKRNPLRRHLSCEIEVDGVDFRTNSRQANLALDKWKDAVVRDGSLSGDGFEINTNPTNGDLFLDHITEVCNGLTAINGITNSRCGLHVHVNVKGMPLFKDDGTSVKDKDGLDVFDPRTAYTHYDLRRLVLLYYRVEPAMFGLCDPSRITSRYSKPCGKFYMTKHTTPKEFRKDVVKRFYRENRELPTATARPMTRQLVRDEDGRERIANLPIKGVFKQLGAELRDAKQRKYAEVRYNALNLHSFFMRGTVEFRHREGTINPDEIINWSLICGHVVDAASRLSEKEIKALPIDPRQALLAILPDNLKQYAERKWAANEQMMPRLKQIIAETWSGHSPETN